MADVTINNLIGQAPTDSDVFPFSTTGVTPSTYKASLIEIKTAFGLATVATTGSYNDLSSKPTIPTKTSDLINDSGFIKPPSQLLPLAWVQTYGTTIQAQYNVTSVTASGQYYTLNFTNPLPNTNYLFVGTVGRSSGRAAAVGSIAIAYTDNGSPPYTNYPSLKTTTQLQVYSTLTSPFISAVIYGSV